MVNLNKIRLTVVGLGYVGLPIAIAWSKTRIAPVLGFDVNEKRIKELKKEYDLTGEMTRKDLTEARVNYSTNPKDLRRSNFIVVALPTPIDKFKRPDLTYLKSASKTIGENLSKGAIVVFESTVYPGVTEEVCGKIIEKYSGLKSGKDFKLAYSPERINPGDKKHTIDKVIKIISAQDKNTLTAVEKVYGLICKAGLHKTPDIKTAEASKVIENIQRDLNIALTNELSLIFQKMGIDTKKVMRAAATKWNIQYFEPGLVSGHCIPVDPYYLTYKAQKLGHVPKIILAGREINEYMPIHVAELTLRALKEAKKKTKGSKILVMGLTLKEGVRDTRNAKIGRTIQSLKGAGCHVFGYDPLLPEKEIIRFGAKPILSLAKQKAKFDAIIMSVIHNEFKKLSLDNIKNLSSEPAILVDIKGFFGNQKKHGFIYRSL